MGKPGFLLLFFMSLSVFNNLNAQNTLSIKDFKIRTPFIEPDNRTLSKRVSDSTFLALSKSKGNSGNSSVYYLELYKDDISMEWSYRMVIPPNENFLDILIQNQEAVLFSVIHDERKKTSRLYTRVFNLQAGSKKEERILAEHQVGNWNEGHIKGSVHKSILDFISSGSRRNFVTPLMYRYYLSYSPDGKKILAYFYDYSKSELWSKIQIWDAKLTFINEAELPINKGHINYGMYVNNKDEVFLLNSDKAGAVEVVKYDLKTKLSVFLDIKPSNTGRSDFKLQFLDDDHVYVANINRRVGDLVGVMYSLFDFKTKNVDKVTFYPFSDAFISQNDSLTNSQSFRKIISSWTNYHLVNFEINDKGEKLLVLEQRNYFSPGFSYSQDAQQHVNFWFERKGQVVAEDILLFSFDQNNALKWSNHIFKKQSSLASDGFKSISFHLNKKANNNLQLIYAYGDGPSKSLNKIRYVELDANNGRKLIDGDLVNDNKLNLIRDYTQWFGNKVVIVGSKGFGRRSSSMALVKLPELVEKTTGKDDFDFR